MLTGSGLGTWTLKIWVYRDRWHYIGSKGFLVEDILGIHRGALKDQPELGHLIDPAAIGRKGLLSYL